MNNEHSEKNREILESVLGNFHGYDWYYGLRQLFTDRSLDTLTNFMGALSDLSDRFSGWKIDDVVDAFSEIYDEVYEEMFGDPEYDDEEDE